MEDFIFNYDHFISIFPEFETCFSPLQVNTKFEQVKFLYCGLLCNDLPNEEFRTQLVYLAMAHLLSLAKSPTLAGGNIKSIRNRQDTITYAIRDSNQKYDWGLTFYGQLLAQKLDLMGMGGFVVCAPDLGYLDGGEYGVF